jgi:hypothetical protein
MKLFLQATVFGSLSVLTACGGGASAAPVNPGPTPAVTAISPNSSKQGGPLFTLSVVGSNFTANSTVHWNGTTQPTTFVNANLLTAAIPAGEVGSPGPDNVTVVDTAGTSNALNIAADSCPGWSLLLRRMVWSTYQFPFPGSPAGSVPGSPTALGVAGQQSVCSGAATRCRAQLRHRFLRLRLVLQLHRK